jgi:hypothetical protein
MAHEQDCAIRPGREVGKRAKRSPDALIHVGGCLRPEECRDRIDYDEVRPVFANQLLQLRNVRGEGE